MEQGDGSDSAPSNGHVRCNSLAIEEGSPLYGHVAGVQVLEVQPGSPAAGNGLRKGDVIIGVNRQPVRDVAELEQLVGANERVLLLNVRRGNGSLFIAIQ